MMGNKMEYYKEIDKMLGEVRKLCNRAKIPFVWVAAVNDDGEKTDYMVAVDENTKEDPEETVYFSNGLIPGSMHIDLADDKIREIVKILNGFKAVPKDMQMVVNTEDLSIPSDVSGFKYDPNEQGYVSDGNTENKSNANNTSDDLDDAIGSDIEFEL